MNAISIKEPWLSMIVDGIKTIETRTWRLAPIYLGWPLLLVGSKKPLGRYSGLAACIVDVVACRPMTNADEIAAQCLRYMNAQSWILKNVRKVEPVPIKGRLMIYQVDDDLIKEVKHL